MANQILKELNKIIEEGFCSTTNTSCILNELRLYDEFSWEEKEIIISDFITNIKKYKKEIELENKIVSLGGEDLLYFQNHNQGLSEVPFSHYVFAHESLSNQLDIDESGRNLLYGGFEWDESKWSERLFPHKTMKYLSNEDQQIYTIKFSPSSYTPAEYSFLNTNLLDFLSSPSSTNFSSMMIHLFNEQDPTPVFSKNIDMVEVINTIQSYSSLSNLSYDHNWKVMETLIETNFPKEFHINEIISGLPNPKKSIALKK